MVVNFKNWPTILLKAQGSILAYLLCMRPNCPICEKLPNYVSDLRTIVRFGSYRRTSDSKYVKRFRCLLCRRTFSQATKDPCFRQKKRQKNNRTFELLASGVSQRRIARHLRINRTTVARKLCFFGAISLEKLKFQTALNPVSQMQFDDLETFEHSKCKPLSVITAVEAGTRRILGFQVARMRAKGRLAEKSVKKYGMLREERAEKRRLLFQELKPVIKPGAIIRSDSNPYYDDDVKRFFPDCLHITCLGQRGAVTGQGELKKTGFDPLFSINHTYAMLRANICRLMRKTWCTTKKKECLEFHLAIYAWYHNSHLNLKALN